MELEIARLQHELEAERQRSAAALAELRRAHEVQEHEMLERRVADLSEERRRLKLEKAKLENDLEAEQEFISLKLTKQLERLAEEKAALAREKAELQRHVSELTASVARARKEKVALEQALEAEEEAAVNKLQRQLQQVTTAYRALESRLEAHGVNSRADGVPAIDATLDWIYGRSPSRNSMDRFGGRRERSVSVSSTSSMRDASHSVMSTHVSGELPSGVVGGVPGAGGHLPVSPMHQHHHHHQHHSSNHHLNHHNPFGMPIPGSGGSGSGAVGGGAYNSASSSPDFRRRAAAAGATASGQTAAGALMVQQEQPPQYQQQQQRQ